MGLTIIYDLDDLGFGIVLLPISIPMDPAVSSEVPLGYDDVSGVKWVEYLLGHCLDPQGRDWNVYSSFKYWGSQF